MQYCPNHATILSSRNLWNSVPNDIQTQYSRNCFKYNIRVFIIGEKNRFATTKSSLPRNLEIVLNKTRCDSIFRNHMYSHNFESVNDPSCAGGYKNQTTKHLFFKCPLLNMGSE
jgi:hypothetical protein